MANGRIALLITTIGNESFMAFFGVLLYIGLERRKNEREKRGTYFDVSESRTFSIYGNGKSVGGILCTTTHI